MNKLSDSRLADVNGYCQYQYPLCSEDTGNCNAKGLTHPMSEVFTERSYLLFSLFWYYPLHCHYRF